MKRYFNIKARSGQDTKEFTVYTSSNQVARIAERVAKNLFYCASVVILSIK